MKINSKMRCKNVMLSHISLIILMCFIVITDGSAQDDPKYTTTISNFVPKNHYLRLGRIQAAVTDDMTNDVLYPYSAESLPWNLRPGETYYRYSVSSQDNLSIDYNMAADWLDPNGKIWAYTYVVSHQGGTRTIKYPVKLDDGKYIHDWLRYDLSQCVVNGLITSRTTLDVGDVDVNPEGIDALGVTADQYIENKILNNVGLEFTRKIYSWAHKQDNNYLIVEMIVKNVGYGWGEDLTVRFGQFTPIKLPEQTVHGFMFGLPKIRTVSILHRATPNRYSWLTHYGFREGDSLRILYTYDGQQLNKDYDSVGEPLTGEDGRLENYMGQFMTLLHADKAYNDPSDDLTQPRYTSTTNNYAAGGSPHVWKAAEMERKYRYLTDPTFQYGPVYEGADILPGLHEQNMDERGFWNPLNAYETTNFWGRSHCGPYEIPLGDSIRFVYAIGAAGLSPEIAWKVGRDWQQGEAEFDGEWHVPLERPGEISDNDYAKDAWVFTIPDSIHKTAARAKWNFEHGMNIPVPPPPPASFTVQEEVGAIKLSWDNNAESDAEFEGYRVYRAKGSSDTTLYKQIFECSRTAGNVTNIYYDTDLERGPDYYYYVTSFSIASGPNAFKQGEILESGVYWIEAFSPSRFVPKLGLSYPNWVDSVRIVPNPYNISARSVQFSSDPDKIAFFNLPEVCKIRIFSENGNLITTINHTDGKSDAFWFKGGQYMLNETGQRVVSGIYIAHIETPDGKKAIKKFVIVR